MECVCCDHAESSDGDGVASLGMSLCAKKSAFSQKNWPRLLLLMPIIDTMFCAHFQLDRSWPSHYYLYYYCCTRMHIFL